jgi:ribonuclease R
VRGTGAPGRDLDAVLLAMWRVADGLRGRRAERGALDMEILEPSVEWGPDGEPVRIHREPRLRSHRLIEEFMLLANEAVARYLGRRAISFMYRVHEPPNPERLEELAALLRPMGYTLPGGDPSRALAALLRQAVGSPDEEIVSYQILRSMKKAQYSERNLGHFGLASGDYTHFTSPIRRYPDLTVHRALVEAWRAEGDADPFGPHPWTPDGDGEEMRDAGTGTRRRKGRAPGADDGEGWREDPVPGEFEHAGRGRGRGRRRDTLAAGGNGIRRAAGGGEAVRRRALAEIARHATEREILADQAERASFQQASALYMQEHLGEEFEGTIVALVKSGLFVRLRSMPVEGLVLLSSLGRDRFRVWETMGVARGERTGRTFRLGESVSVRAVRADVEMRQIDFELLAHTPRRGPLPPERPPSRRERGARRHRRRS